MLLENEHLGGFDTALPGGVYLVVVEAREPLLKLLLQLLALIIAVGIPDVCTIEEEVR